MCLHEFEITGGNIIQKSCEATEIHKVYLFGSEKRHPIIPTVT